MTNKWILPNTVLHPLYPFRWRAYFADGGSVDGVSRTWAEALADLKLSIEYIGSCPLRTNIYDNWVSASSSPLDKDV